MKTVSSIVENYIKNKPFLLTGLSQGIINLTSLSRNMMQELSGDFPKDVKQGAIVMALKRLTIDLDFRINNRILRVLKNIGEITVRSSLCDYTFVISNTILDKQAELITQIKPFQDVFYTSSRGVSETNIMVSESVSLMVEKLFEAEKLLLKLPNLASITGSPAIPGSCKSKSSPPRFAAASRAAVRWIWRANWTPPKTPGSSLLKPSI